MSYTPDGANRYRDDIQAYNMSAAALRNWYKAYAKARNSEGRAHIVCHGDSVTSGYRSSSPQYTNSWPARLRTALDAHLGVVTGTGFIKADALEEDAGENRFSYSGTWAGPGGGLYNQNRGSSAGGTVTLGPITADRIRVYYMQLGNAGTVTATLDGSAAASIVPLTTPTAIAYQDYTMTAGSHTLVLTAPSGGSSWFYFAGWEAFQNGTSTGVRVSNCGFNGQTASALMTSGATSPQLGFDLLAPDLTTISFGLNEAGASVAAATFKTNMQNVITKALAVNSSVILVVPPQPAASNDPSSLWAAYRTAYYDLADSNGVGLVDTTLRWKDVATSEALGFKYDGQHPNSRGYWDMGNMMAAALFSIATP